MKAYGSALGILAALALIPAALAQVPFAGHTHPMPLSPEFRIDLSTLPAPQRISGVGTAHIPITTRVPEAQAWFDQGLALLHCFWYYEELRAFEQAVRLDPGCAMCHWGLYHALDERGAAAQAREELERAVALSGKASDREQRYIRADAAAVDHKGSDGEFAYGREMDALIERYPDDVEAKLLYASHLSHGYDEEGNPRPGTLYGQMLLREVLRERPDSVAANHYWIHAVEKSGHPDRALASAERLAALAPASGHIVHMPGHIYYELGDYERARVAFLASMRVDSAYLAAQHVRPQSDFNYAHNLSYLVAACAEAGRHAEARKYARALDGLADDPQASGNATFFVVQIGGTQARLAMRYAQWADVIDRPPSYGVADARLPAWARDYRDGLVAFARGMLAIGHRDAAGADGQAAALDALLWRLSKASMPEEAEGSRDYVSRLLGTSSLELRGAIAGERGDLEAARSLFEQAEAAERKLGASDPPESTPPAVEMLASMLARAGHLEEARAALERALAQRPHSGFALYGIADAWRRGGDVAQAVTAYRNFLAAWGNADGDLPQVIAARRYIAANAKVGLADARRFAGRRVR
jgi:tetratricopeptide (TPR) repeat protein